MGMVPVRWRRRADVPLGNAEASLSATGHRAIAGAWDCVLWTSVRGESEGY